MCDAVLRFHVAEYRLLFAARYRSSGQSLDLKEPGVLSQTFANTIEAALGLLELFMKDFVANGYLTHCFAYAWIGLAIVSVWLTKVGRKLNDPYLTV